MVNPASPVKVRTGLPLAVVVSLAPVSVDGVISIGPKTGLVPGGVVSIVKVPTDAALPRESVAEMV